MNWYYAEAGQQAGPVDDAGLEELVRSGKIRAETLVWREGMANWQPYGQIMPPGAAGPAAPPMVGGAAGAVAGGTEAVCAECGRIFDVQNMISYGNARVCAQCKPIFMQKLAEGARLSTGALNYAGFWTRFGAVFLDGIILYVVNMAIKLGAGLSFGQAMGTEPGALDALQVILFFVGIMLAMSYEVILIGKYGATVGKMAAKIKVVTADGGRVSYPRAFGRYFAKFLSGIICLAGYIMAGFDEEKRALHDRICDTRVIFK
jgi:uncharacterized RDD family membrane protein YckC